MIEFLEKTFGWLPEAFAYEFSPWEEILGTQVLPKNFERIGKDEFLASALYEMSFNGMTREGQEERREELSDAIAEHEKIQNMPPEEREKHLFTLEDVMERLGYTDDRAEEERREERRQGLLDCVKTRCAWITEFQNIAKDEGVKSSRSRHGPADTGASPSSTAKRPPLPRTVWQASIKPARSWG